MANNDELGSIWSENDFVQYVSQNAAGLMWFLGSGASRSAGMPSASDIIWDLKRRYFCLQENQNVDAHDINKKVVQAKIQSYLDSRGFPVASSAEEYSFYFELLFKSDYEAQQRYISAQMAPEKISLNIGHRILAAMIGAGYVRTVFTTNFDSVLENAYAEVNGKDLTAFSLEGSYAALDALNAERFPLYAKIHGDFRYRSLKNLAADLLANDREIQRCFLTAATRFGLIVAGYSGRDRNVMKMLNTALEQVNPFPHGLFWTTPRLSDLVSSVKELIAAAREKGVRAHAIESGTFDILLSRIWRQLSGKPAAIEAKVYTAKSKPVSIPLPRPGSTFPIVRTNALPVEELPQHCGTVVCHEPTTYAQLNERAAEKRPDIDFVYTEQLLFWGNADEVLKLVDPENVAAIETFTFEDPVNKVKQSTIIKAFYESALVRALCTDKPLHARRRKGRYYAVVDPERSSDPTFTNLRSVLGQNGQAAVIAGFVPQQSGVSWAEAVSINLEERNGALWLLIRPEIWIKPMAMRETAVDFLKTKKLRRYNAQAYGLIDAWIEILLKGVGANQIVSITAFPDSQFRAAFLIGTRTAFSKGGGS